jgi:hypothetical protein
MARNLRRALADSRATATANFYGFTPAEAKEFENIPRILSKKQEIEVEKRLLEKNGRYIERIENAIPSQNSIILDLIRESDNINNKVTISKGKTQTSKKLINAKNEKIKEELFIERSNMRELEYNLREYIKEKGKIERKITRLMEELETIQRGGKKRVFKRKARSAIRQSLLFFVDRCNLIMIKSFIYYFYFIFTEVMNSSISKKYVNKNKDLLLHLWTFKMPILVFILLVFSYLIFLNIFGLSIICSI